MSSLRRAGGSARSLPCCAARISFPAHNNAQAEPLPQPRHIVAVSPGEVPWNDAEKARMQALNERDVAIDYAFMVTVEKFMRHGRESVPDYMVYLVDDKYLFTGDTLWFGADGGYSFISTLAENNRLAVRSLAELEAKLKARDLHPLILTGHTGWTDNFEFAFAHKDQLCSPFKKRVHDPSAPYDAYDESDDTPEQAKAGLLKGVGR